MNATCRLLTYALVSAPGLLLSIHLTSCSLIGLGVGAAVDAGRFDHSPVRLTKIRTGSNVAFRLDDGSEWRGRLVGIDVQSPEVYGARYREWRNGGARASMLPQIDDTVTIVGTNRVAHVGRLVGFGAGSVSIADEQGNPQQFAIMEVAQFQTNGEGRGGQELAMQLRSGAVPLMHTITIETKSGLKTFTADQITYVMAPSPSGGKTAGFMVGLAMDVLVVAAASSAASSSSSSGCEGSSGTGLYGYETRTSAPADSVQALAVTTPYSR